jgi:hypothetical protein
MSESAHYRAQADRYLRQAEQAELLEKLSGLPVGSVITFTTQGRNRVRLSWAARLITIEDSTRGGDYWYFTGSPGFNGREPQKTSGLIRWLITSEVDDVEVVVSTVALRDWQPPKSEENK